MSVMSSSGRKDSVSRSGSFSGGSGPEAIAAKAWCTGSSWVRRGQVKEESSGNWMVVLSFWIRTLKF